MPFHFFKETYGRRAAEQRPADPAFHRTQRSAGRPAPQQPSLRPLVLVARQEARAAQEAARRLTDDSNGDVIIIPAGPMPPMQASQPQRLPQPFTGAPSPLPRPVRPPPVTVGSEPAQLRLRPPSRVTYNVNDRIERARALRTSAAAAAQAPAAAVRPTPPAPLPSELPYLVGALPAAAQQPPSRGPCSEAGRGPEQGRPRMVPPRRSSLEVYRLQGRGPEEAPGQQS